MNASEAIAAIREILYPNGDMEAEWSSDELPLIADVIRSVGRVDDTAAHDPSSPCAPCADGEHGSTMEICSCCGEMVGE